VRFPALPLTSKGLAQAGLPLHLLRGNNVQIRTKLSAELLPRLRQTARYMPFFLYHYISVYYM